MPLKIKRPCTGGGKREKKRAYTQPSGMGKERMNLQRRRLKLHRALPHRYETCRERMMNLALKIQKHRRERGLTQEELAEALGVSHQSISKWESGQTLPGLDKVLLISDFFQLSMDYLLKDEVEGDQPPIPPPLAPQASTPPATLSLAQPPLTKGKNRFFFYLGLIVATAGCSGIVLLWVLSLLHPPYTLGKTLGPIEMFSFYIRYNELETHLMATGVTALSGMGILLLYRLRWLIINRRRVIHADHRLSQTHQNTPTFSEPEDR